MRPILRHALLIACLAFAATGTTTASAATAKDELLVVNIGEFPTSLDPSLAVTESDRTVQHALFAALYRSPGGSNGVIKPFLAAGAPVVASNGLSYTVRLRAAKWSDGKPITATDVRTAYLRRRRDTALSREFDVVRSAKVVDARTIRFELTRRTPWFDELLASNVVVPVPTHVIAKLGNKWATTTKLVSSGPFKLKGTRGRSQLELVRNDKWWAASTVRLEALELRAVPIAGATPLFTAGRIDATMRDTSVLPELLERWKLDKRFRTVPSQAAVYLHLNTANTELASAAVRRGIALAIDRVALAKLSSGGVDQPLETVVPSGLRGSNTIAPVGGTLVAITGAADPTRAKAELANGGWVAGSKLDLYYPVEDATARKVAGALEGQLDDVGIDVVQHGLTEGAFAKVGVGTSPTATEVDMVLAGWQAPYSDPQAFHARFTCASVAAGTAPSNYCSSDYDQSFAAATTFARFASRVVAQRAVEQRLTDVQGAMPSVPLYEPVGDYLVQPWVHDFAHTASGRVDFERVRVDAH